MRWRQNTVRQHIVRPDWWAEENSRGFLVVEANGAHLEIGKFDLDGDGQTGDNFAKGHPPRRHD
jgi:hypothetical protein